jgi:hypothetical protein
MATITTLRPSATTSGVGWTALPSGTLDEVTSDDSDLTYAEWSGSGSAMILQTPVDSPPIGERRHLVRLRARGEDGSAWWAVRLATGGLVAGAAGTFGASPETISGSWATGAPADGASILSAYVTGQSPAVKITELYLDVDSRLAPTFTAQVLDGTGTSTTTVSDTATPTIRAASVDLDDLPARQYRFWVTLGGATVWDTGIVSGAPIDRQTSALENGSYVANLQVWSTLGANTAYASDIETVAFTLLVGEVPAPDPPVVTPEEPLYRVEVCAPDMSEFDTDSGYIEIQRVDCPIGGYLLLTGSSGGYASGDPAAGTLTDLEVTFHGQRDDGWRPATDEDLVAQWQTTGDERAFILGLNADGGGDPALGGRPYLAWSADGINAIVASATDRAPIDPFGRVHVRAFLDVDDGAGGWSVTFESLDQDGEWVQLGDLVTNSGGGTTAVFASTAPITVGAHLSGALVTSQFVGRVYSAQVRDGRAGSILASPDFTIHASGTEMFVDAYGADWTIHPPASLTSSQAITTIAMIGPLETAECAEWVDFTLPRTSVALTCDHQPEPCCSFYRARTVGYVDEVLVVSDWSDASPEFCLEYDEDYHLIRTTGPTGPMFAVVVGKFDWDVERPFTAATGVMGTRFVTSAEPGGRNLRLQAAVESEAELAVLHAVIARPLVLTSPSDSTEVWAAPVAESVKIVKVGRIRQLSVDFIATGPEPAPQLADVGA